MDPLPDDDFSFFGSHDGGIVDDDEVDSNMADAFDNDDGDLPGAAECAVAVEDVSTACSETHHNHAGELKISGRTGRSKLEHYYLCEKMQAMKSKKKTDTRYAG